MLNQAYSHSILVVDDEPGILRLCRRLLERAGFSVHTCLDPYQGLCILEKEPVSLLLVDIRMPVMDGFQLIDLARQRLPDLAVVVMTGFGTVETAIEALRQGADGLILKPFSGAELVQSVQRAHQENQQKQDVLRLQTLRPLFAITEALFTQTNSERLLDLLVETVCGHLRCQHAGVYRRQVEDAHYTLVAGRGELPAEEDGNPQYSLVGRAESWNISLHVNKDGPGDPELQQLLSSRRFASVLAAPLTAFAALKESGIALIAARSEGEAAFRESDLEIFAILARQAAVALENARLHEELRTYLRQVEESQRSLIQAEKLAIAGRLTASIAHEINNPLQAVQNCLHLTGRQELTPEERQNYLNMAQDELERLMNTVQRMLDYYRPTALDRKTVEIHGLINKVLQLLDPELKKKSIRLQTRYSPGPLTVWAVGDQIQQVLLNLLLNAVEAMPRGGTITLETAARKKRYEILIEDTGPGVPAADRNRIFEPFTSSKERGTGLGLAVSYGIISAHGGSLELVSGRGSGACFRISLPCGETS